MTVIRAWLFLPALVLWVGFSDAATVVYVDPSASNGNGTGENWSDALPDLQSALQRALPGDEIWVAAGLYLGTGVTVTGDIQIYGGFGGLFSNSYPGGETQRSQRSPQDNPTVLSADVLGDDVGFDNRADNLDHVLKLVGDETGSPLTDGLTITGGYCRGTESSAPGGAIAVLAGAPTVQNCTITQNATADRGPCPTLARVCAAGPPGGGIYIGEYTAPRILQCTISGNVTGRGGSTEADKPLSGGDGGKGAGIFCAPHSRVLIVDCKIVDNQTGDGSPQHGDGGSGGGVFCDALSEVTLRGCLVARDRTGRGAPSCRGGGNGGSGAGIYANLHSTLTLENCRFSNNGAGDGAEVVQNSCGAGAAGKGGSGGALFSLARTTMIQCEIDENRAGDGGNYYTSGPGGTGGSGGGIYLRNPFTTIVSCRFLGNSAGKGADLGLFNYGGDGGAIFLMTDSDSTCIENTLIAYSQAGAAGGDPPGKEGDGGAISTESLNTLSVRNCTIYGNVAPGRSGGIFVRYDPTLDLGNSILWGNQSPAIDPLLQQLDSDWSADMILDHSCVEGLAPGVDSMGSFGDDPSFPDVPGMDGLPGTLDDDFGLGIDSPCLNAGENALLVPGMDLDLDGQPRIHAGVVDLGAFENQQSPEPAAVVDFSAHSESGRVRVHVSLTDIRPDARLQILKSSGPEFSNPFLLLDSLLVAGAATFDLYYVPETFFVESWYQATLVGSDRGVAQAGPVSAAALAPVTRILPMAPNPFTVHTTLRLIVGAEKPGGQASRCDVYDVQGRVVRHLFDATLPPGEYSFEWNGLDQRGAGVATGVYYVNVQVGRTRTTLAVVHLR